jgi:two-component system sensor histidine kinase CpxA
MRTLFGKILLWFLATITISLIAVVVTSALTFNPERQPPFGMLMRLQVREARWAYESGGKPALQEALQRFGEVLQGEIVFTDAQGRDVLTGADRNDLLKQSAEPRRPLPWPFGQRGTVVWRGDSVDSRYSLFVKAPARSRNWFWFIETEHLWILGVVVLLCYALAFHLTSPVRALQRAVDRFGRGEFDARAPADRRDELGQLAQTFNRMADRIETLLKAERRLLMDISHELRSPLARLSVAIELARNEQSSAPIDRIQKEADRLNALVNELIEVTRAEGDPEHRRMETIDLGDLLSAVAQDCRIEADARGCRLTLKASPGILLQGDPELLRRAVENVIRNAIRYAPPDTDVEISLDASQGKTRIRVRDHGPGVPESSLPHLFEAFYRVDSDRNRLSGGVGLGLSIARRSVELHGGSIRRKRAAGAAR